MPLIETKQSSGWRLRFVNVLRIFVIVVCVIAVAFFDAATGETLVCPIAATVIALAWVATRPGRDGVVAALAICLLQWTGAMVRWMLASFDQTIVPSLIAYLPHEQRDPTFRSVDELRRCGHFGTAATWAIAAVLWLSLSTTA